VPLHGDPGADAQPTTREPEEVRALMSSYRTGTMLGRFDAQRPPAPGADGAPAPTQRTDRPDER